jgi:N-formylglutamate amidohydrolase
MKLPLLVSLPHAGKVIPPEVKDWCLLKEDDIIEDGDKGANEIYGHLRDNVMGFVTTDIARAIVDLNRNEDDISIDGVVKTHSIWMKQIYDRELPENTVRTLINRYWRPYHEELTQLSSCGAVIGIDCHTMVETAPPISPISGQTRPSVCLGFADGTCPEEWIRALKESLEIEFRMEVKTNDPFRGGYIIRKHSNELPWMQIEMSRGDFMDIYKKKEHFMNALIKWTSTVLKT